jgi:hypothetical protein
MIYKLNKALFSQSMTVLKSIVLLVVMMIGMPSLGHIEGDVIHSQQTELEHELCSHRPVTCECHECDNLPCGMDVEIDSTSRCTARVIPIQELKVMEFDYTEIPHRSIPPTLRVSETIIALRTVQLLI